MKAFPTSCPSLAIEPSSYNAGTLLAAATGRRRPPHLDEERGTGGNASVAPSKSYHEELAESQQLTHDRHAYCALVLPDARARHSAAAWLGAEIFLVFVGDVLPLIGVSGLRLLAGDVGP